MNEIIYEQCPGCKASFIEQPGLYHSGIARFFCYGVVIPECTATFSEILDYERTKYRRTPRTIVDAYTVQHPPNLEQQLKFGLIQDCIDASVQPIAASLVALYSILELKNTREQTFIVTDRVLIDAKTCKKAFTTFTPPADRGTLNAKIVHDKIMSEDLTEEAFNDLAQEWAQSSWQAWSEHHAAIQALYEALKRN